MAERSLLDICWEAMRICLCVYLPLECARFWALAYVSLRVLRERAASEGERSKVK